MNYMSETFLKIMRLTNKELNKNAKYLLENSSNQEAFNVVNNHRALHFLPLIRLRTNLHQHFKAMGGQRTIVQRLKRIPTIIDKMRRFPDIGFASFQDIGGIRVIVESISDIYSLKKRLDNAKTDFAFQKIRENDRIKEPKSKQGRGYRSLHLIYKFHSQEEKYNNLKIELQIRTKLQNLWATTIEAVDIMKNQSLKSGLGRTKWNDFFEIVSSNFALLEKQPLLPEHTGKTQEELKKELQTIEKEIEAIKNLKSIMVLSNPVNLTFKKGTQYCIIILDSQTKNVDIKEFKESELEQANEEYANLEKQILSSNESKLTVLVSAKDAKKLQKGYAGYFLDVNDFVVEVEKLLIPQSPSK